MLKWLEPAIEKRIIEVADECEVKADNLYAEFMVAVEKIRTLAPESLPHLQEIENYFNMKTIYIAETSYRSGFNDGYEVGKKVK